MSVHKKCYRNTIYSVYPCLCIGHYAKHSLLILKRSNNLSQKVRVWSLNQINEKNTIKKHQKKNYTAHQQYITYHLLFVYFATTLCSRPLCNAFFKIQGKKRVRKMCNNLEKKIARMY